MHADVPSLKDYDSRKLGGLLNLIQDNAQTCELLL